MTVFFGFPVNILEAFRIFNLELDEINSINDIIKSIKSLEDYLLSNNSDIKIYETTKGLYIIGYEIKEVSNVWSKFIDTDELIFLLLKLKKKFVKDMDKLNANWNEITLKYMESETTLTIKDPTPYIIEW